jgi:hypothetical protein
VTCASEQVYVTEFNKGLFLTLDGSRPRVVTIGLSDPSALAVGTNGTIYLAEFGRGAVRRVLA